MSSIVIDGKKIELKKGESPYILQVALKSGIYIPNLCYHKKLLRYGGCRLCLVEIKGVNRLAASCATIAADKMVVTTNSPRLQKLRRTIIELLLVHHPLDCWTCDKGGECDLQNICYYLGLNKNRFPSQTKPYAKVLPDRIVQRDMNKCVKCARCVRSCLEVRGNGAIGYINRGFETVIAPPFGQEFCDECTACGRCIDVCPVGALTSSLSEYSSRPWQLKDTPTICPYCGIGCSIVLRVDRNGKVAKVKGDDDLGINAGELCVRGHFGYSFVNHKDRLKEPLLRREGVLEPVSWEKALGETAFRLKQIIKKDGADAVAALGSARVTNEDTYLFQKFIRGVVGTNNIDYNERLSHTISVEALSETLGLGAMTNTYEEIKNAEVILNFGLDVNQTHPVLGVKIFQGISRGESTLISINPIQTKDTVWAKSWARIHPGTENALINGLINELIRQKLHDKKFIEDHTSGFEKLETSLKEYTREKTAEICGIDSQIIEDIARAYGKAKTAVIIYGDQVIQTTWGKDTVLNMLNLALVAGKIGKKGCGLNGVRNRNNSQGASDMGLLPNYLPGYNPVEKQSAREHFAKKWNLTVPEKPGLTLSEMIDAALAGKIKAMIIMGENPLNCLPESKKVREALRKLEFLVVIDIFLTDSARLADIILPAASFAEKDGTFTNSERRVQRINSAMPKVGSNKADREIIIDLAKKMGVDLGSKDPKAIMDEITETVAIYKDIDYAALGTEGSVWGGGETLYQKGFPQGKVLLRPVTSVLPQEPEKQFPFTLMTTAQLYHSVSGTMSRRADGLVRCASTEMIDISEIDAEKLMLKEGAQVLVTSRHGEMEMPVRINSNIPEGVLVVAVYSGPQISALFSLANIDPVTKSPAFQLERVSLEKQED